MLNPLIIPASAGLQRDRIVPAKYRLPDYDEKYDFHTLAYDVVWMPQRSAVLLVCPRLLNLAAVLRQGTITLDGQTVRPRIQSFRRHDEVWLSCKTAPARIEIVWKDLTLSGEISRQSDDFKGQNVLMTKSKDNALEWLTDWARHHRLDQGATAALVFDNGSTAYDLKDAQTALGPAAGLATAKVIASDFPFGSWRATKLIHRSMFYQAGMLNLARHRFLHNARAVLPIDVDEMVTGASAFDAAHTARLGYVTIPSVWRYSKLPEGQMPLHSDHIWRREPDAWCKEKYCLAPARAFTNTVWDIHGIRKYAFNRWTQMHGAKMLHCEHISTGWKRKRDAEQGETLVRDPLAEAAFAPLR